MAVENVSDSKALLRFLLRKIKDLNNRVERLEADVQKVIENMENK